MSDDDAEDRAQEHADETRKALGAAIQTAAVEFTNEGTGDEQRGLVIGWLVIAEVLAPDGERWLTSYSGDAAGEKLLPRWQAQGYAHSLLHDWPPPDEDE